MTGLTYLLIMMLLISAISEYANGQEVAEFAPVVAAQEAGGGSITGYLLGGWSKDGWLHDQEAARLLKGGEIYRFYNLSGELGEAPGKPPASLGEPCSQAFGVTFDTAPACAGGIVGVGGQVKAMPRQFKLLGTDQEVYKKAAAAILRQKGIRRPEVNITQVIRVDLEGDGKEEVLVSATHYGEGLRSRANPGDYSLIFLRRISQGRVVTRIIEGDFFPMGLKFGAPREHRVGAILDLNGDGVMEIVLFGRYYEGDWITVYRIEGGKVVKLFSVGCGA